MRYLSAAVVVLALSVSPAFADDDGGASSCLVVFCNNIDVANNAISTEEILNGTIKKEDLDAGLKDEIEGKADKSYVDGQNTAQDTEIGKKANKSDVDAKNGQQDRAIRANFRWDLSQQRQLNRQDRAIERNYAWDWMQQKQIWGQGQRIGSLENLTEQHSQAISAHSALLSQHSARLDQHAKGLAIAMALPDAWIEANKRFAIAGNIGGFDGETAIGAAAIFRLDETWSVNGKLGTDTDFEELGWTVGARASW